MTRQELIKSNIEIVEPIAIYHFTWDSAIYILDIEYSINDTIVWRYNNDYHVHHSKVYSTNKGEYIKVNGIRYYLQDFYQCINRSDYKAVQ